MITPTVGRVVLFHPCVADADMTRGEEEDAPLAAIITRVWSDELVNLAVFDANGISHGRTSVKLRQSDEDDTGDGSYAEWMQYQKGQAARSEELERKLGERNGGGLPDQRHSGGSPAPGNGGVGVGTSDGQAGGIPSGQIGNPFPRGHRGEDVAQGEPGKDFAPRDHVDQERALENELAEVADDEEDEPAPDTDEAARVKPEGERLENRTDIAEATREAKANPSNAAKAADKKAKREEAVTAAARKDENK